MRTLSQDDFQSLRKALLDAFTTKDALDQVAKAASGGKSLDRLALGANLEEIVPKLIERSGSEWWTGQLIEAAWQERQGHAELTRLRAEWATAVVAAGGVDPFRALMLHGKTVLIDRTPLRDALATLDAANGSRVLIVDGDAGSGKTYSVHYISYLSTARQSFWFSYVDLERVPRNQHNRLDALTLGNAIARAMSWESAVEPLKDQNLTTWIHNDYCPQLKRELTGALRYWLVIDNFGKVPLEESVLDLVAAIAMGTYLELASLRLVLLSYRDHEWLQARVMGTVEYERISAIGERDLVRFFSQIHLDESRRRGDNAETQALAERVLASVRRVLEGAPAAGARRLEALGRTAWAEAQEILRPPPGPVDPLDALVAAAMRRRTNPQDGADP